APDPPPPLSSCLLIFNTSHLYLYYYPYSSSTHHYTHSFPTRRSSDLLGREPAQEIEGLLPAPPERAHRMLGVRAEILALVGPPRSEEHTSNSSHGSISYAVFCLKKKKQTESYAIHSEIECYLNDVTIT